MADFKLPTLPEGFSWGYADDPESTERPVDPTGTAQEQVGSVLREIAGPRKQEEPPSFLRDFLKPTVKQAFKTVVPTDPTSLGTFVGSLIFGGPGGPLVRAAGKLAPEALPVAEALGSTLTRRVLGVGATTGLAAKASGENPLSATFTGIASQLGGEGLAKLTQWSRANAQVRALAQEDPERLGSIVSNIVPNLGKMRSAKDFHAAFKKGAAQQAISDAYQSGFGELSQAMAGKPVQSVTLTSIRTAPRMGSNAGGTNPLTSGLQGQASFSFDDVAETIRRLRYHGWNEDELARGLSARDSREAAEALQTELVQALPPDLAEKYLTVDSSYARGKKLIDFFDDKSLFKENGDLNIPKLQQKIKADGYNTRQSYEMAADAAALEEGLFRGASTLAEDVAGKPGAFNTRVHLGFLPTFYPHPPTLGSFAGRTRSGLSPFAGSQVSQLLRRGINAREDRPNTLRAEEAE